MFMMKLAVAIHRVGSVFWLIGAALWLANVTRLWPTFNGAGFLVGSFGAALTYLGHGLAKTKLAQAARAP